MDVKELFKEADELLGVKAPVPPKPIAEEKNHWKFPLAVPTLGRTLPAIFWLAVDGLLIYLSFRMQYSELQYLLLLVIFWVSLVAMFNVYGIRRCWKLEDFSIALFPSISMFTLTYWAIESVAFTLIMMGIFVGMFHYIYIKEETK